MSGRIRLPLEFGIFEADGFSERDNYFILLPQTVSSPFEEHVCWVITSRRED